MNPVLKSNLGVHMIDGARQLQPAHLTVRLPWHDSKWNGSICQHPCQNSSCTALDRIGQARNDGLEHKLAGKSLEGVDPEKDYLPPCVEERGAALAPFPIVLKKAHPYVEMMPQTHGHFGKTTLRLPARTLPVVPFRWMLREQVEGNDRTGEPGLAERMKLGYSIERERELTDRMPLKKFTWVQEYRNQNVLLDTFASAIRTTQDDAPHASLIFLYCKATPLSDSPRRVIVGVAKVTSTAGLVDYSFAAGKKPQGAINGLLWERVLGHSLKEDGSGDGFLMPYTDVLAAASRDSSVNPEAHVAFAPDDYFESYSYATEHLSQDGAIASLLAMARALEVSRGVIDAPIDEYLGWIDVELNRLWRLRGAFPGLGSALSAFGLSHGNLLAWFVVQQASRGDGALVDPWPLVSNALADPSRLPDYLREGIGSTWKKKWDALPAERRALLQLLSRFDISEAQATRWYQESERKEAGIRLKDADVLANPYVIYEEDRLQPDPIGFEAIDRGLFADEAVRTSFPVPAPSQVSESIDPRRLRAAIICALEAACLEGHTMLPVDFVITRVRALPCKPDIPLDRDTVSMVASELSPHVTVLPITNAGDHDRGLQLIRYVDTGKVIEAAVRRAQKAKPHEGQHDWRALVDSSLNKLRGVGSASTARDERARTEKAAALKVIHQAWLSVLIGGAGTGKSTLIHALCQIDSVERAGVLMLAPTGKARVRLEKASGRSGGMTVAQFLQARGRYDWKTHRYHLNPTEPPTVLAFKTVIVDECSMLTEEQLAAVLEAVRGAQRIILLGDPNQLPPIGAGHPFVSIERELRPEGIESAFPKVGPGYAALTVAMRQEGGDDLPDLRLANVFGGPGKAHDDSIWHTLNAEIAAAGNASRVKLVQFERPEDVAQLVNREVALLLDPNGQADEIKFEQSIGGTPSDYDGRTTVWFNAAYKARPGAAERAEAWQILTPVRKSGAGSTALNRAVQRHWRLTYRERAMEAKYRVIPYPAGPEAIIYGDKVINTQNRARRAVWPEKSDAYVANGDIGIVIGQRRTKQRQIYPKDIEVEMSSQLGFAYKFGSWEFSQQDGAPPLELAYALTVHKSQGSEFNVVFLVIPNPCANLSREMLYTALTRHKEKIVILHQGDFRALQVYASELASDIAGRMTSLFGPSRPVELPTGTGKTRFLDANLVYRTQRGDDFVRSKSELIIADRMHAAGIRYFYERPVELDGIERLPDFTIEDASGRFWYWEHCGMMSDPGYATRWEQKRAAYARKGIVRWEDGGGPGGFLLVTEERDGMALDLDQVQRYVATLVDAS